jgi:predicted tellurium resistance membrane protein TerC
MESLFSLQGFVALLALTSLEIVLGIDNIVFIAIVCQKLPREVRDRARILGLSLAVITRVALLFFLSLLIAPREDLFEVFGRGFGLRELVLLLGGGFLIFKATREIHHHVAESESKSDDKEQRTKRSFSGAIAQILLIDIVFSFDSVITAIGIAESLTIMVTAVLIAIVVMLLFSKTIVTFIEEYPTLKMLALSFILLVGVVLLMEGMGTEIQKGYIYFAMGFSLVVEMLNIKSSR